MASAETSYDQNQDARISQTRAVVKNLWIRQQVVYQELDEIRCDGDQDCINAVENAYAYMEQWPGWVEAAK